MAERGAGRASRPDDDGARVGRGCGGAVQRDPGRTVRATETVAVAVVPRAVDGGRGAEVSGRLASGPTAGGGRGPRRTRRRRRPRPVRRTVRRVRSGRGGTAARGRLRARGRRGRVRVATTAAAAVVHRIRAGLEQVVVVFGGITTASIVVRVGFAAFRVGFGIAFGRRRRRRSCVRERGLLRTERTGTAAAAAAVESRRPAGDDALSPAAAAAAAAVVVRLQFPEHSVARQFGARHFRRRGRGHLRGRRFADRRNV